MKTTLLIFASLITSSLFSPHYANACTVTPVNATQQKNDLVASALTKLDISIENVGSVNVKDYMGGYIMSPMCPIGISTEATFTISFTNILDPLTKGCLAIVKVSKRWVYESGNPNYSYDLIQPPTCLE